jgi:hypothetical protein
MLAFLKDHPFAVESFFDTSLVLTFAVPKEELQSFIPECLTLDTFEDRWAFLAVAIVKTKNLRPKGFPQFMGNDFVLTGYRVFVRYVTRQGKRLRGLYIIRSETDKLKMAFLGNIFTHYNYQRTDMDFYRDQETIRVCSNKSALDIEVKINNDDVRLPQGSPFRDWKEARRFAGPLPFTFTYNQASGEVLIIEGVRQNWTPKPVEVVQNSIGFMKGLGLKNVILANAFVITGISYYWKKGIKDLWKQP